MHLAERGEDFHTFTEVFAADGDGVLDVADEGCGTVEAEKFVIEGREGRGGGEKVGEVGIEGCKGGGGFNPDG